MQKIRGIFSYKYTAHIILGLLLLLSLLPILQMSFYTFPVNDDYVWSGGIHWNLKYIGFWRIPISLWGTLSSNWFDWQGTFFGAVMMALTPSALFGEQFYFLTAFTHIIAFLAATYVFTRTVIGKRLSGSGTFFIFSIISFVSLQYLISPRESFYWWNGASYYTLIYTFFLMVLSVKIRIS